MSRFEGPQGIVTNGLVLNLDAGDPDSYTRSQPPYVEVLVVAGGGSGGPSVPSLGGGGGGGAGGVIYNSAYQLLSAAAITVTVGAGGAGASAGSTQGNDGSNSVFGSLTAVGGGGGGSGAGSNNGRNGGSGGGAGYAGYYNNFNSGTGTAGQGFRGGYVLANNNGGGGGGAGGVGGDTFDSRPEPGYPAGSGGLGGPGVYYSISGTSTLYSTGGNGGTNAQNTIVSGSGTKGSYGGEGGTSTAASGIVIVRYPGLPAATGGTITYLNGYTVHTFTSSGTFTPYLWNDVSGNGNNSTLNNGTAFIPNIQGGYFNFDGTDDNVTIPNSSIPSTATTNKITICFWSYGVVEDNASSIIEARDSGGSRTVNIHLPWSNNIIYWDSPDRITYQLSTGQSLGWHYWSFTRDPATGVAAIYQDGVLLVSGGGYTSYINPTTSAKIGSYAVNTNFFIGRIGVAQIYNRALTQAEISQNFAAQYSRFGIGWPSAQAILAAYPNATSGYYPIQPLGSSIPVMVYCDMETDGGGWMHVGTVNDSGGNSNDPVTMPWGAPLNPAQNTGIWQDTNTLNESSPSFTTNYKNRVWYLSSFTQMLIKDQGDTQRNLLYTNSGQISSNNSSLSTWFGSLSWAANGSEDSNSAYNNGRVKGVSITNFGVADPLLDSGNKTILLFKFGEYDGAQDGNKDRSMIAWARYNAADNVDTPAGIGTFTNRGGTIDYRDVVPYAQRQDYPYPTITGGPYNYSIWVR